MTRFTTEIAAKALVIALPFLKQVIESHSKKGIAINTGYRDIHNLKAKPLVSDHLVLDGGDFVDISKSKYQLTLETGLPSREAQLLHPETTGGEGQTIYWGSWIDGFIIVAISGLPPEWDEVCSKLICGIIKALLTTQSKKDFELGKRFT